MIKVSSSAISNEATQLSGTANIQCNDQNRGKMNFMKDVTVNGRTADVMGICMKNTDGSYYWGYMMGGGHTTTGSGAFGSGL